MSDEGKVFEAKLIESEQDADEQARALIDAWRPSRGGMVELFVLPDGVIAGDDQGRLRWLTREQACALGDLLTNQWVIPASPNTSRLEVPALVPGTAAFDTEVIELQDFEVNGYRGWAGYGPRSQVWYIQPDDPTRAVARGGA